MVKCIVANSIPKVMLAFHSLNVCGAGAGPGPGSLPLPGTSGPADSSRLAITEAFMQGRMDT